MNDKPDRKRRGWWWVSIVAAVLFSAGCSRPMCSYAAYNNWRIEFEGYDGVISKVSWFPSHDNPSSLVVHLDGNDLDHAKFASAKTMRSLGAHPFDAKEDFGL